MKKKIYIVLLFACCCSLFIVFGGGTIIILTLLDFHITLNNIPKESLGTQTYDPEMVKLDGIDFTSTPSLNEISYISTHNSYHQASWTSIFVKSWRYEHPSITQQLIDGVRAIEFDVHFSERTKRFTVFHSLFDEKTSCATLSSCLSLVKSWSQTNNQHLPIFITIQVPYNNDKIVRNRCTSSNENEIVSLFDTLEREILTIFNYSEIFFPKQQQQGNFSSLMDAIINRGWPSIDSLRGKVFFGLSCSAECFYTYQRNPNKMLFVLGWFDSRYNELPNGVGYYEVCSTDKEYQLEEENNFLVKCCAYVLGFEKCKTSGANFIHVNNL